MKRISLSLSVLMIAMVFAAAAAGGSDNDEGQAAWLDDYKAAATSAHDHHKMILIYFTGSDWCENCQKLDKGVLSKPEFAKWAKKFVLVKIDTPHHHALDKETKEQNEALVKKYKVAEWPTIFILDDNEVKIAKHHGYHDEDPAAWTGKMDELIKEAYSASGKD